MAYASLVRTDLVPQTERLNDRQARNNGGGFSYVLDDWARLDRFLILGSDASTAYQSARKLTRENAKVVELCWKADFRRTVDRIVEISVAGRAAKNSAAIVALALGTLAEDVAARQAVFAAMTKVCRTASDMFEFASICDALGKGWGRGLKNAFRNWYETTPVDRLGYQMAKYRNRHGYTHTRLVQRVRPRGLDDAARVGLYRWAAGNDLEGHALPDVMVGHLAAMKTETASELVPIIERHGLTWETVPTWALKDAKVWEALLPNLGLTALLRNLGTLTSLGVLKPLGRHNAFVEGRLLDPVQVRKSRLHPYAILYAMGVYRSGKSEKGERAWQPVSTIIDALNQAFYLAFDNIEPTGKRFLLGLDVSGSMVDNWIGSGILTAREASAAMAMVTARAEKAHAFIGFSQGITRLGITASMSLPEVMRCVEGLPFQYTDCAAPMLYAMREGLEVDTFVIYTDNETNKNSMHPSEALKKYRRETGIKAKLIVAAMTSTGFSIADPNDAGMLDIVGFDTAAPTIIRSFVTE